MFSMDLLAPHEQSQPIEEYGRGILYYLGKGCRKEKENTKVTDTESSVDLSYVLRVLTSIRQANRISLEMFQKEN